MSLRLSPAKAKEKAKGKGEEKEKGKEKEAQGEDDALMATFTRGSLEIGVDHPSLLAESQALRAVSLPKLSPETIESFQLKSVVDSGRVSTVQLEAILHCIRRWNMRLPMKNERAGFFLGDGTVRPRLPLLRPLSLATLMLCCLHHHREREKGAFALHCACMHTSWASNAICGSASTRSSAQMPFVT